MGRVTGSCLPRLASDISQANFYVGGCARKAVEFGTRTVPSEAKHWLFFWRRREEN